MAFAAGTRLGVYEITGLIGVGGMGEVYRATDTKLGRTVAIKTLPSELANDADRLARFEREARLLAALNHAHIASIYGLHEHEGTQFLAMELVEGETLDRKLRDAALPVEDKLRLALQIAEALEAAHEKGVVHRDLKPANVMVTNDGAVKVLDFGLAKAFSGNPSEASPAHSPALSLAMTQRGLILGTAGYMSPEQASGQATDQRADIWAFGVVLFEMLTGAPLFSGESVPHILADVLRSEPDWTRLPKNLHPRLKQLLERCLEKKVRNRYHSIADVRVDIEKVLADPQGSVARAETSAAMTTWPRVLALAGAFLAGGIIVGIAAFELWPSEPPHRVTRFSASFPGGGSLGLNIAVISRDGTRVALRLASSSEIYVRNLDEFDARPIATTRESSGQGLPPCFSPDGMWIAYTTGTTLKKAQLTGGAALTLADGLLFSDVCDWGDDGYIYFGADSGIMRVAASGGEPELVADFDAASGESGYENPRLLPGGKHLLFSMTGDELNEVSVAVLDLATHEKKIVLRGAGFASYARTEPDAARGHILYGRSGTLFAVPFNIRTLEAGAASPVLEGIAGIGPIAFFSVSDTGTLVYLAGRDVSFGTTLRWVDRAGSLHVLPEPTHAYNDVVLSPDGQRVAVSIFDPQTLSVDLWLCELDGDRLTRLTFGGFNFGPVWTPNGQRLIYSHTEVGNSESGELRAVLADNSAPPTTLAAFQGGAVPSSISSDGSVLLGSSNRGGGNNDIWALPLGATASATNGPASATLRLVLETRFNERDAMLSPNARFLAYTSNESGRDEVYVVPYPGPGGKTQISTNGGSLPRWRRDGSELFYFNGTQLMAVDIETTPVFRRLTPHALFEAPALANQNADSYDVAPDGKQFLMLGVGGAESGDAPDLRIVINWFEELKRLAPTE